MAGYTRLTGPQLDRAVDLFNRLYRRERVYPCLTRDADGVGPFADPAWRVTFIPFSVLMGIDTTSAYYNERLGQRDWSGWPVGDGLPEIKGYMEPLLWCLKKRDEDLILFSEAGKTKMSSESEWRDVPPQATRCSPDVDSLNAVFWEDAYPGSLDIWVSKVFGPSGDWALDAAFDPYEIEEQFLGGTPAFIEEYYAACGGEDNARAWAYHYDIMHGLRPTECDGQPDGWFQQVYNLVGWPYPTYPKGKHGTIFKGEEIDWSPMFGDRFRSAGPRLD